MKRLYAPFWTYNCVDFQLCPRFKNGGQCRPMADPYLIVRGAIRLGAQTASAEEHSNGLVRAASPPSPAETAQSGDYPNPVLIVGEGAATEVLARLFVEHPQYMFWREPRTWRATSHMPDELYASMLRSLYKYASPSAGAALNCTPHTTL